MSQQHSELILETEEGVGLLPCLPPTRKRAHISQIITQPEIEQYQRQTNSPVDDRWSHLNNATNQGTCYTMENGKEWLMGLQVVGNTMMQRHEDEYILKMPLNNRTKTLMVLANIQLPYSDGFDISLRSTGKLVNRQCYRVHLYNLNGQVLGVKFGVYSTGRFKNWRDMEIPLHDDYVQVRVQDTGEHVLLHVNGYQLQSPPLLRIVGDFYLHLKKPKKGHLSLLSISYVGRKDEGMCGCSNSCSVF